MSLNSLLEQGVTVLTASRRLAHALRLGFARHAQAQGLSVWPTPRALPWSAWLRQQHLESRPAAAHSLQRRVLTPAQARVLWDDVVSSSRLAADLLSPSNAARLAARSWRRLHEYLIDPEAVHAFATPEAQALGVWCEEFARRCASLNVIDEASLARWAWDVGFVPNEVVAFAGFDVFTPELTRLVDRWRESGKVREIDTALSTSHTTVIAATDVDAELDLAAQWARNQLKAGQSTIGVIVPELQRRREEIHRVFEDVFAPHARRTDAPLIALPVVIAAPAALSSYPLVDAALLILQLCLGEASSTLAGRLLRSSFLRGGQSEQTLRAQADVKLREEQRERWDWFKLEQWAGVQTCDQLAIDSRHLCGELRQLPGKATASEWAQKFHALWMSVGWPGDRPLSSVEHQTLGKFQDALAQFGTLDIVASRMNFRAAVHHFQSVLNDTQFEPETGEGAITVIDAATSAGMQFDALWVMGLEAERWPSAPQPDALIPLELQRLAGVPEASASGMLAQAKAQLARWRTSSNVLVLSWPERNGDIELARSPLLNDLARANEVVPHAPVNVALCDVMFAERPVLESLRDDRAPMLPQRGARGGARTIELQSRCPFRAQAEVRLAARKLPRVSLAIEPVDRGAILHHVLEDVWRQLKNRDALVQMDDAVLESNVRASAERHAMRAIVPDSRHRARLAALEIESAVRLVMRLLAQERQRPPFAVQLAEASEQYEIGGLSVTLRPDRIDLLEGEGQLLIDYKLGDSHRPRDWFDVWPGRPRRPQLPLYGLAHAQQLRGLAYVVLAPGAVEYRGWSDGTAIGAGVPPYPTGVRIDLGDPSDWEALLHQWRFSLTRLAQQYVAGEAQVDPLPQECSTCHLCTFCRIHERLLESESDGVTHDE
ncbi:MAG: PD-(D/E)XK nuclease family protein [Povalibacter sp.]